ncbi:FecR family protein [Sphingomonas crocodyli]|uniref:Iron dicitrate transport regulator FecR n=1 Tax=Sphingomonas crocodyli TaxID=1979270 RepID=A0A437M942_9SPHN|nr:FecR domain-containing protein [Sphingomonas crocodyli]RVT94231.1 iron dicitrate transport regulator FecR [Sphingomonas crocodyli]
MPKVATLAVAAAACVMLVGPQAILRLRADHISPHGEISRVALADGSVAMLDSDSAIAVDYDGSERHVRLLEGRAWFQVRHGDARPFRVAAGDGVTEDVGTAFEVDATGDQVRVGVTEGAVRVSGRQGKALDLRAGDRGGYAGDRAAIPISGDRDDIAGWRRGELLMRSMPLDTAIHAIARYRSAPVFLWGDFAAAAPVSGSFRTDQPEDALATLIVMRGLDQVRLPGGVLILRPKRAV